MITFAGLVPHSPLLLKKDCEDKFEKTLSSFELFKNRLLNSKPDTIVFLSTHAHGYEKAFCVNLVDEYQLSLEEFGDFKQYGTVRCDTHLCSLIKKFAKKENIPLSLDTHEILDFGTAVPLIFFSPLPSNIKIITISDSLLDLKEHVRFGQILKDLFINEPKRIAVILTCELAHSHTTFAPFGFHPNAKLLDMQILDLLSHQSFSRLRNLPKKLLDAKECAVKPLTIFSGIIEKIPFKTEIFSYEIPFGVGSSVIQFHL